ncbi:hypothetical protein DSLASN_14730 [Desulfoluna limicola]|uniref:Helix-turn-helix domain-containing protein n=2 Tax=Desulfoluna limicola TaxID=2810562 RepID=A0ABN6F2X8_9BACT|nr:hypothetical protein DSLASN_14730 [Desulfoluna limicola]
MAGHNDDTQEHPSFGSYLRDFRVKNGLTVESVCHETKLSRFVMESIEAGNRSALPEDALLKSFLRNVAAACGADGETAVSLYLEEYPPKQENNTFYSPQNRKRSLGLLCLLLCLIFLVAGGVLFFFDAP